MGFWVHGGAKPQTPAPVAIPRALRWPSRISRRHGLLSRSLPGCGAAAEGASPMSRAVHRCRRSTCQDRSHSSPNAAARGDIHLRRRASRSCAWRACRLWTLERLVAGARSRLRNSWVVRTALVAGWQNRRVRLKIRMSSCSIVGTSAFNKQINSLRRRSAGVLLISISVCCLAPFAAAIGVGLTVAGLQRRRNLR
jgi:hypothetical protein